MSTSKITLPRNLKLSCGSKTFLLGEYLVLNGGGALMMNTEPRFELLVRAGGRGVAHGFNPESPAGLLLRRERAVFGEYDVEFRDPHLGCGGLGASSAQYLLATLALLNLKTEDTKVVHPPVEKVWTDYLASESVSDEGLRPSGADIVTQYMGHVVEMGQDPFRAVSDEWPFTDLDVILVHTGHKLPTHEHLRQLRRVDTEELRFVFAEAMDSIRQKDSARFTDCINDYHAELLELNLVAEHTQVLVASLLTRPFVRAAKGCGAMGSDVIAIFVAPENREGLRPLLNDLGLPVIADTRSLSAGVEVTAVSAEELAPLWTEKEPLQ